MRRFEINLEVCDGVLGLPLKWIVLLSQTDREWIRGKEGGEKKVRGNKRLAGGMQQLASCCQHLTTLKLSIQQTRLCLGIS